MLEKDFYKHHHKYIWKPEHIYVSKNGTLPEHRLIVEKVLGKYLHPKHPVHHHYNKDGSTTLVICEDQQYHSLLEQRTLALRYSGNANHRKCVFCKRWDKIKNLHITLTNQAQHRKCVNKYHRERG